MCSTRRLLACLALLIVISACSGGRYELGKDDKGQTVRLDKRTGEVSFLVDDVVISAQNFDAAMAATVEKVIQERNAADEEAKREAARLAERKDWPEQTLPHLQCSATLATSWRDGMTNFQLWVRPFTAVIEKGRFKKPEPYFSIMLSDSGGFPLLKEQVSIMKFVKTVDDDAAGAGVWAYGSIPCSKERYQDLSSWDISSRYF